MTSEENPYQQNHPDLMLAIGRRQKRTLVIPTWNLTKTRREMAI